MDQGWVCVNEKIQPQMSFMPPCNTHGSLSPSRCCWSWQHFRCHCSRCALASPTSTGGEKYLAVIGTINANGEGVLLPQLYSELVIVTWSLHQWRLWEVIRRGDSADQPHLRPDWVWHRHQSWPLWQGEPSVNTPTEEALLLHSPVVWQ